MAALEQFSVHEELCTVCKVVAKIPQMIGNRHYFNTICFTQFALRCIPSHIQQFTDAFCRLLPCNNGSISGIQCGIAVGDVESVFIKPCGNALTAEDKARAALAVFVFEKSGIVSKHMVFFEI
jgi:hypothetical protein